MRKFAIFGFASTLLSIAGLSFMWAQQPAAPAPAPAAAAPPAAPRGGRGGAPQNQIAWAPKPLKATGWAAPNKPHTKLSDILAKHTGQSDWSEVVVDDNYLHAEYVSMGQGKKTPKRFNADTREWWVVQDGQIRFTIDGEEPFVASKGYLVQVPYRNAYSMETVGDKPSLRYEVNIANATRMYPIEETPVPVAGFEFVRVRIAAKGKYENGNRPFIDFNNVVAGTERQRRFIADDRAVSNIIIGNAIAPPALTDKGHFHTDCAEFWFILQGKIRYNIQGVPVFEADQGDVVYAPKGTWHLASHGGEGQSTRLAMNGFQDIGHSFEAPLDR